MKHVPKGPMDNMSILVELIKWRQTGDTPMMTKFTDTHSTLHSHNFCVFSEKIALFCEWYIDIYIYVYIYIYNVCV